MAKKHLVLLHDNDLHGDFLAKDVDGVSTGGLARLSGYVDKARKTEGNVIYAIAGDMFQGSVIDSEFQGLSTIDLINALNPDVVTIGNHEVDYGVAHLLFLEKCAQFPIINANMYITLNHTRLFLPYLNIEKDGMKILFIGILTEEVISSTRQEQIIGTFIDIEQAAKEIGIICDNYRTKNTDLTVLLTHIGIEKDRELAEKLDPRLGVNLIIGGHTHTFMEEPEVINGIQIVQAGTGTGQIGRFDITYDTLFNKMTECRWQCVPINEETADEDPLVAQLLNNYRQKTDEKYQRIVTRFARKLTHPVRNAETELGNLYADLLQDDSSYDVMLLASGSIRKTELGPLVTYQEMTENTPYDGPVYMVKVTGAQFRRIVKHLFRDEAWTGHTEFYQFSKGMHARWNRTTHALEEFTLHGKNIEDDDLISLGIQDWHFQCFDEFFGVPMSEVLENGKSRVAAVSFCNIVEEYLSTHPNLDAHVEGRIEIVD